MQTCDVWIYKYDCLSLCFVSDGKDLCLTHAVIDRRQSAGGELCWRTWPKKKMKSSIWMGSQETIRGGTGGSDQRLLMRLVVALQRNASAINPVAMKWWGDAVYCYNNKSLDLIAQRTKWMIYKTISSLLLLLRLSSTARWRWKHTLWLRIWSQPGVRTGKDRVQMYSMNWR